MNKLVITTLIWLSFLAILMVPTLARAADTLDEICQATPQATVCLERNQTQTPSNNRIFGPDGALTKISQIAAIAVAVAAVLLIIVGGIKYALSGGDSAKINSAKDTIIYAIIGIVVALLAQAIIVFVLRRL